jgi:hypothetical protein
MPEPLKPHQQRVIQEERDLRENIVKLDVFLSLGAQVDVTERGLLVAQLASMRTTLAILQARIAHWQDHPVLTLADSIADLEGTPRPDHQIIAA